MPSEQPDDQPAPAEEPAQPDGVFGNLPQTRPGARSPRRDGDRKPKPTARKPAAPPPEEPRGDPPPRPDPRTQDRGPTGQGGGFEDVAWAGVAAAAEAATIGVRLATRALERMRDAVDRG